MTTYIPCSENFCRRDSLLSSFRFPSHLEANGSRSFLEQLVPLEHSGSTPCSTEIGAKRDESERENGNGHPHSGARWVVLWCILVVLHSRSTPWYKEKWKWRGGLIISDDLHEMMRYWTWRNTERKDREIQSAFGRGDIANPWSSKSLQSPTTIGPLWKGK